MPAKITVNGKPASFVDGKWVVGYDDPEAPTMLDEVTVTAKAPRDALGIPLYNKNGTRREYDDAGMKDNLDWVALHIMYPAIAAVAAPELGPVVSGLGKLMTPSTYISRVVPWVASRFGASIPTATTSLIGAGADMALTGYFAHEGYKGVKEALQHPENLLSWTDYGKVGLDALMAISPLSEVGKTASALNKSFRIPFLIDARRSNRYMKWANYEALKLLLYLNHHNFSPEKQRKRRSFFYRPLNFVAGLGLKSKSWQPAIKEAATKGVQRSMDIFDQYYRTAAENTAGHPIDLGKAEDYTRNMAFSYLPWDKWGVYFNNNRSIGQTLSYPLSNGEYILSKGKLPVALNMGQDWRDFRKLSAKMKPRYMNGLLSKYISTGVHEPNHAFTLDPNLEKSVGKAYFGHYRVDNYLPKAYETLVPPINLNSDKVWERAAVNAEIRNFLNLTPEEIEKLPTERFIRLDMYGRPITIIDDLARYKRLYSSYMLDYNKMIRTKYRLLENLNKKQGGKGSSEIFPNFAEDFARKMKETLLKSYKKGGKI